MDKQAEERLLDLQAWETWKNEWDNTGVTNNEHWPTLKNRMESAVNYTLKKFGNKTDVPAQAIAARARRAVAKGVQTYDPNHSSGAQLFTHVVNTIRDGTQRFIQQGQNAGHRTPEHRGYGARADYSNAASEYEMEKGYVPSDKELGEFVTANKTVYPNLYKQIKRNPTPSIARFQQDVILSAPGVGNVFSESVSLHVPKEDEAKSQVRYQLSTGTQEDERKLRVMELMLEQNKTGKEVARILGITEPQVSSYRGAVIKMLNAEMSKAGRRRARND